MQPNLSDQNTGQQQQQAFRIIPKGKLPNSSYYDISTASPFSHENSPNTGTLSQQTIRLERANSQNEAEQQQNQPPQPNENLDVWACVFSPDQRYLAWSCGYGLVKIMKWKEDSSADSPCSSNASSDDEDSSLNRKKNRIIEIECTEAVWSMAFGSTKSCLKNTQVSRRPQVYRRFNFNEDRMLLAVGLASGKIRIYDGATGRFLFVLFDHKDIVRDLKFTKDGTLQLASVSRDETIKLWNMYDDGNMYKTLKGHVGWVYACDWSPIAQLLCSVGSNRQAFIWNTENYSIIHKLKGHLHDVVTCEFSPDGALLATGSYDTKICLWDPYTGDLIKQFFHLLPPPSFIYAGGHNGAYVRYLTFSANGDHLLSICDDKKIRIWSLCGKSSAPLCEETHKDGISCAYSSNSRKIFIGTRSGHLDFYEVAQTVPRLVDICRKVVNQYTERRFIKKLCLPNELKRFLMYENLRDQPSQNSSNINSPATNQTNTNMKLTNSTSNQYQTTLAF